MSIDAIINANCEQLRIGTDVLKSLPSGIFSKPQAAILDASLGQHWRHISDHYHCFLDGVKVGHVNYANRSRDARLETDLHYAMSEAEQLIQVLAVLANICEEPVEVCHEPAIPGSTPNISSLTRELEFLFSHTAHHFAMMSVVLRQLGVSLPAGFGLAASTLRFRAAQSSASSDGSTR